MKLHLRGIEVPKLGTPKDKIYRQYLSKESQLETKKVQLLALLVSNFTDFGSNSANQEWSGRIKKIWDQYLGLEFGVEVSENTDHELQMMEYYQSTVKKLRPKLSTNKDGKLKVSGLDVLKD